MSAKTRKSTSSDGPLIFDIHILKEAWTEYKKKRVFRVLKNGKWETHKFERGLVDTLGATQAGWSDISTVMSFPKFLEDKYG